MAARIVQGDSILGYGKLHFNQLACDDAFDATSEVNDCVILDAHGFDQNGIYCTSINDQVISIIEWCQAQPETKIFLSCCNPSGCKIEVAGKEICYVVKGEVLEIDARNINWNFSPEKWIE